MGSVKTKTAKKTAKSPRNGQEIPLGNHPGNTGGKKGRSGRRPYAFVLFAQKVLSSKETMDAVKRAAANEATSGFPRLILGLHQVAAGREGMISLEAHWRYVEQLGMVITKHVHDPELLRAIETDAQTIAAA